MAEYETYKDSNGVTWRIVNAGSSMSAFIAEDQSPRYNPEAPDQGPAVKPSLPSDASQADITERDRRTFINLRELIDDYASKHKGPEVVLRAIPDADKGGVPGWVVALVIIGLAMMDGKKGRRR